MKNLNTQIQQTRQLRMISTNPPSPGREESAGFEAMGVAQQAQKVMWSGRARAELKSCKAEQVWPLWADFGSLCKWFPNLGTSQLVEGEPGKVGSIRLCVGKLSEDQGHDQAKWAKERLVEIDDEKMFIRYELIENNVGLKGYVAVIRVAKTEGGEGCEVEWSFEADAVEGWGDEVGLQRYVESSLESIVIKMEEALLLSN